jgi:hypothetical protein
MDRGVAVVVYRRRAIETVCCYAAQWARLGGAPFSPPRPSIRQSECVLLDAGPLSRRANFFFLAPTQSRQTQSLALGTRCAPCPVLSPEAELTALHGSTAAPPALTTHQPNPAASTYLTTPS